MKKSMIKYIEVRFSTKAVLYMAYAGTPLQASPLADFLLRVVVDAYHRKLPIPKAYSTEGISLQYNDLKKDISNFDKNNGFFIIETRTHDDEVKTEYNLSAETLLHYFSQCGTQQEVQALIMAKALVNQPTHGRLTPLILAAGRKSIVQVLLDHKADPSYAALHADNKRNALDYVIRERSYKPKAIVALLMAGAKPHDKLPPHEHTEKHTKIMQLLAQAGIKETEEDYKIFFLLPFLKELISFKLFFFLLFKLPNELTCLISEYYSVEILELPMFESGIAGGITELKISFLEEINDYLKTYFSSTHAKWLNHLIEVFDQSNFYSLGSTHPFSMAKVTCFHLRSFIRLGGTLLENDALYGVLERVISKELLKETIAAGQREYEESNPISKALAKRDKDSYKLFCELTDCKEMPTDFKVEASDFSQRLLSPPVTQVLVTKIKANLATALQPCASHLKSTAPRIMEDLKNIMTLEDFFHWSNAHRREVVGLFLIVTKEEKQSVTAAINLIDKYLKLTLAPIHPVSTTQDSYCSVM